MTKVGLFGGSFNPVHVGHVALARQLREQLGLDEVWLMLSPQNPLKSSNTLLADDERFALLSKALADEPGLVACDYELHLPRPSYTFHTLEHLRSDYPDHHFTLLIGADNWQLFHRWYRADDILALCPIAVYPRPGCTIAPPEQPTVTLVEAQLFDVSSTLIRSRVAAGESIMGLVPPAIESDVVALYGRKAQREVSHAEPAEPSEGESLKEKTAKGMLWGGLNNVFQQFVGVIFGIVLGRLLMPDDYGLMAMIGIFSLMASALQESGFKSALANERAPKHEDYNSVFWFNILVAALMYVILFSVAPLIARYYHEPRLVALCRYAFLSVPIASWGTAQGAYLFKNLMVGEQARCGMTAILCSATVAVVMAWQGFGYWALATQGLVYVFVNTLLLWHYSPWRPSLSVSFAPVCRMFRFSCKMLATYLLNIINNNVLNILLGRFFNSTATGFFNQAYQWNFKAYSVVQGMVQQVAQPVLADVRDERERQLRVLRKMVRFTAFLSFPLLLGFALVAHEFIVLTIKDKWVDSVPYLQWLCLSGGFMPLSAVLYNLIISRGKSGTYFWSTATLGALQIAVMLAIWPMGIGVMVKAYTLLNVAWFFVWHQLARRLTGYSLLMMLRDVMPFFLAALGVMGLTWVATRQIDSLWLLLVARVVMASLLYYGVMRVARVHILKECEAFVLAKLRKK